MSRPPLPSLRSGQPLGPPTAPPPQRRKVRFVDTTPSPSLTRRSLTAPPGGEDCDLQAAVCRTSEYSGGEMETSVSLTGFCAPEVVDDGQVASSSPSSRSSRSLESSISPCDELELVAHVPNGTVDPASQQSSHWSTATYAAMPSMPTATSTATAVKGVSLCDDDERTHRVSNSTNSTNSFEQPNSSSIRHSPSSSIYLSAPRGHMRTPSPQQPPQQPYMLQSSSSPIVAFSSRIKGSSLLFAPPRKPSDPLGRPELQLISPIDFNHHLMTNNAPALALPANRDQCEASEISRSSRSQSYSRHSPTRHPPMSVQPPPSSLALPSAMPASLPSRDISSLRGDAGVGHSMQGGGDNDNVSFDVDFFGDDLDEPVRVLDESADDEDGDVGPRTSPRHAGNGLGMSAFPPSPFDGSFDPQRSNQLPMYTRILRIFLMCIGVVRYTSFAKSLELPSLRGRTGGGSALHLRVRQSVPCVAFHAMHSWFTRVRSYLYPLIVFLFILTNLFVVTVSKNVKISDSADTDTRNYNNWVNLISEFCMNGAPLLSWVAAFYMVGWDDQRATLVFFEQLSNLELYNKRILRNYLVGSGMAGLVLMATINLTDMNDYSGDAVGDTNFFTLVNAGLFVLMNYLITTFVICALASTICIFHYYSLLIFKEQLYSQAISVQEAIKEHIVLMRLQHESASYLQYVIFPPLVLYTTGAFLAAYNMITTQVYDYLASTVFQLMLAFVTLMIPLVSGAQITAVCNDLARLATNLDLTSNLVERTALIQQLVLLPGNAYQIFGVEVSMTMLAKLGWVVLAGVVVIARGATISTTTTKGQL